MLLDKILGITRIKKDLTKNPEEANSWLENEDYDEELEKELNNRINERQEYLKNFKFNKFSPLHCAAYSDNDQLIESLVKYYDEIIKDNETDVNLNNSPNNPHLFDISYDLNDEFGRKPLHIACMAFSAGQDCCEHLTACLNSEINFVNPVDNFGFTPGMIATRFNNTSCLSRISDFNNDHQKIDDQGFSEGNEFNWLMTDNCDNSILTIACNYKSLEAALYILDRMNKGHELVNLCNTEGVSPLHLATRNGLRTEG